MLDRGSSRLFFVSFVMLVTLVLLLPSVLMTASSFSNGRLIGFPPEGFSLRWYAKLLDQRGLETAFFNTIYVAGVATIVSTIAGTLGALALARYRIPFKGPLELYLLLPLIIPIAVEAVGLLNVFGATGLLGTRWAIGVAIAASNLPFSIGTVAAAANRLDPGLEDAASSCGARPIERFLTITVPAVMPGVLAGALLQFISGFNEFVICSFLVDTRTMTLAVELYNEGRGAQSPAIAAISVLYTVVSLAVIMLVDRLIGIESLMRSSR
jgi:putative spermidine/putrescine transport system permease protein